MKNISRGDPLRPSKPWVPKDERVKICSRHFRPEDFQEFANRRVLKKSAMPTVFSDYPSYMQKSERPKRKPPTSREVTGKRTKTDVLEPDSQLLGADNNADCTELAVTQPMLIDQSTQATVFTKEAGTSTKLSLGGERSWAKKCRQYRQQIRRLQLQVGSLRVALARSHKTSKTDSRIRKCTEKTETIFLDSLRCDTKAEMLVEQINAYGEKCHHWSESTVRRCIKWRSKSPRCYEMARNSRFFTLPSASTLQNYLGPSTLNDGMTPLIKKRLTEELTYLSPAEKFCSLIFDEMSVKEQLKYVRNVDKVVGRATLYSKSFRQPPVANRLLCFVITGLSTGYRIPVAYYLTKQMEATQLHNLLVDIILEIEKIGFRVIRLVCDCLSVNVKAYSLLCSGKIQHQIEHPAAKSRILFLSFDPCHIIKNIRNQFIDNKRCWTNISSQPLKDLYKLQQNMVAKPVRFLTKKILYPSNFEKMNVGRAVKLFSTEMTAALKLFMRQNHLKARHLESTIEFMEIVRKWFEIHNVHNTTQHFRERNSNKEHFWGIDDARLSWLTNDFLPYIEQWRNQVHERASQLAGSARTKFIQHHFLTEETYADIKLTTMSTSCCIAYLLENGFQFVLTRRFNSDPIELLFSSIRQSTGSCDATTALSAMYSLEKFLKIGVISSSPDSNSAISRDLKEHFVISKNQPILLNEEDERSLHEHLKNLKLAKPMDSITLDTAGLSMIAGFCIKLIKDKHICDQFAANLADTSKLFNTFISDHDRGGLQYPSPHFCGFVKTVFDCMCRINSTVHFQKNIVKFWLEKLIPNIPDFVSCGCSKMEHTDLIRRFIVIQLAKIFVVNLTSVADKDSKSVALRTRPISKKVKKL